MADRPIFLIIHMVKRTSFRWSVSWLKSTLPAKWTEIERTEILYWHLSRCTSIFDFIICHYQFTQWRPVDHNEVGALRYNDIHADLFEHRYHVVSFRFQFKWQRIEITIACVQPFQFRFECYRDRLLSMEIQNIYTYQALQRSIGMWRDTVRRHTWVGVAHVYNEFWCTICKLKSKFDGP